MNFFSWVRRLLFPPPRRDVSHLGDEGDGLDVVYEEVDTSGKPLKEGHTRRALRDPRLLPKRRTPGRKRRRVMDENEASRLFAPTMQTADRGIRDLLPDPAQLERYGLPAWTSEYGLAEALGISVGELRFFSIHRQKETAPHYVTFTIPKRGGGRRLIMAPKRRLKAIQRALVALLVSRLPVSEHAHAFRTGRSIRTGAEPHVGRKVLLHMDLKDFFPSVHVGRVRGLLIALGYGFPVATTLAVLMTESVRQPVDVEGTIYHVPTGPRHCVQGAPTSPGICNAILLRLDRRLAGLARAGGFRYTRYADDLTFSGDDVDRVHRLRAAAAHIIRDEGFEVNTAKTRVMKQGARQRVTGVVVNEVMGLSRVERRRLRAAAHRLTLEARKGPLESMAVNAFRGRLAYLHMLNAEQAAKIARRSPLAPPE